MRIYTRTFGSGYLATAPEVPGAWERGATEEEALARCRESVREELAAYERLGSPLQVSAGEQVVDGTLLPALVEDLLPATPDHVVRTMARLRELRAQIARFLGGLGPADLDARSGAEWSVRLTLDHVASGEWIFTQRLDVWPLDPVDAQRAALDALLRELSSLAPERRARRTEHFGLNDESGRVRWTPRKVARVVAELQRSWLEHLRAGGAAPGWPSHADGPKDGEPLSDPDVSLVASQGAELLAFSRGRTGAGPVPLMYQYYRLRLTEWPDDPRERWETIARAFDERIARQSETELALVRATPAGGFASVRQVLGRAIAHLKEHFAQMRSAAGRT